MTARFASFLALMAALIAGCSSTPPTRPEPVDVSGVVLLPSGSPLKDATINFFPTSNAQAQGGAQLKADGKFAVKLVPGKYTYAIEGNPAALKAVPTKYQSNDAAHSFEIPAAGKNDLTIKLEN